MGEQSKRRKPFSETHPDVAAELVDPSEALDLPAGSTKRLLWQCKEGHRWEAQVNNRTRGTRCPYCAGRKVLAGYNDLATVCPDLAAELVDPTLAWTLRPGSNNRVEWICPLGHRWFAAVNNRANGTGCPYCTGKKVLVGFNDLQTLHPELAAELVDQTLAQTLRPGSSRIVKWQCAEGHRWETTVANRAIRGTGCAYCVGLRVLPGLNDLWTTHPHLARELADPEIGTQLTISSSTTVEWNCEMGHRWSTQVASRSEGAGCPVCAGRKVEPGENCLQTTHPDIAAQLVDKSLASKLLANSRAQVEWECEHGHRWVTRVSARTQGRGCLVCTGRRAHPGFNDLASVDPALATELVDPALGHSLTVGSHRKVEWTCAEGHRWLATVTNRRRGTGCPYCSGFTALAGFNDLQTTHPALSAELVHPDLAKTVTAGSTKRLEWRCALGHEWSAAVSDRSKPDRNGGCPVCTGKKVLVGFNDLATTHPALASEMVDPSLATQVSSGSHKVAEWECAEGHRWKRQVCGRAGGAGCPVCSGLQVLVGFNDLATVNSELAAQLVDTQKGFEVTAWSSRKLRWRCSLGHEWVTTVSSRTSGSGCPECGSGGFSQVSAGWLYLVATPGRRVYKFGISNDVDQRLAAHAKQGLTEVLEVHFFESGADALAAETAVLRHAREHGWSPALSAKDLPHGGASETLLADDVGADFSLAPFVAEASVYRDR